MWGESYPFFTHCFTYFHRIKPHDLSSSCTGTSTAEFLSNICCVFRRKNQNIQNIRMHLYAEYPHRFFLRRSLVRRVEWKNTNSCEVSLTSPGKRNCWVYIVEIISSQLVFSCDVIKQVCDFRKKSFSLCGFAGYK